ncbi:MAG: class I SAM-dependent methyltransferase [Bacteroidota bacterium]
MKAIYNTIGDNYNFTRKADDFILHRFYQHITKGRSVTGPHLDIGCGTGNYTIPLAQKGLSFIGVDPSEKMILEAQAKSKDIDWRLGQAEQIPLADAAVDTVIAQLTIHHWQNLEAGFREIHRVLRPNGRFVLFTSSPQQMQGYWLNHYFPKMMADSIQQMPALPLIEATLEKTSLQLIEKDPYAIRDDLKDLFLYAGKNRPELYFQDEVRSGISSFAALANRAEVERGLVKLQRDIEEGRFAALQESYRHEAGDYLFIIAKSK